MDTIHAPAANFAAPLSWTQWLTDGADLVVDSLSRAAGVVYQWQERSRQRHDLLRLSDAHLKDIGLSRADAEGEAEKPFYQG